MDLFFQYDENYDYSLENERVLQKIFLVMEINAPEDERIIIFNHFAYRGKMKFLNFLK